VKEVYDVTIIGGGPIGLFTAFYCGMRKLKTKIIEASLQLGGKISLFYPEKIIRDIGGIPQIKGELLVKQLIEQAKTFDPTVVCGERADLLERSADGTFVITCTNGNKHYTKTIILAVGHGLFKPKKLKIDGAEQYLGTCLHYTVDRLSIFEGKDVVISGGGNTAVDWANELSSIAKSVTIVHRKDEFSAHEQQVERIKLQARICALCQIKAIHGKENQLDISVENLRTKQTDRLKADHLLICHGIESDFGNLVNWGLKMAENRFVVNNRMETNIPGIFAVGDAVIYPNKLKLIAGGFMEGPVAVNSAAQFLHPDKPLVDLYSTHYDFS
jgi:thioredoxin reductase (NADPH)